jgi:alginate O-acetyltransferase complex protein AlgI
LIFTSISYLLFLPFIVLAYYICPARFRWLWLVLASVAYYLSFIPIFFALIGVLVAGNYFTDKQINKEKEFLSFRSPHLTPDSVRDGF